MVNLDYYCMKYGQKIGLDEATKETDIRKALGILQEDGIYAMFLWLEKNKSYRVRKEALVRLYNENPIKSYLFSKKDEFPSDFSKFTEKLITIAGNYNKLVFMKEITMRTLTYALYHTKIRAGE